ncbi:MAG: CDGSH iron-sulfur domain-containing protein [Dehalococcoidia bacterium]
MTTRAYETGDLRVLWDSQRCIHVAECIRALPRVFNPLARPWVRIDAASAEAIVDAVTRCPTGALRYELGGAPLEAPDHPTTVTAVPNGPLLVRGDLHVVTGDGETLARETRLALCRCGASENKPFCDNAHRRIGFVTEDATAPPPPAAPVTHRDREDAESPGDLGPAQPPSFRA